MAALKPFSTIIPDSTLREKFLDLGLDAETFLASAHSLTHPPVPTMSAGAFPEAKAGPIPLELREYTAVYELLSLLLGFPSDTIGFDYIDEKYYDVSIRELVKRFLPICQDYQALSEYTLAGLNVENGTSGQSGLVCQAWQASLKVILTDYDHFILSLEAEFRADRLNLSSLWSYLQTPKMVLSALRSTMESIRAATLRGNALFSLLVSELEKMRHLPSLSLIYAFLIESTAGPIIQMTFRFIEAGVIFDPCQEFFIAENKRLSEEDLIEDFNCLYWTEKWTLIESRVPYFLKNVKERILWTGKYNHVLRSFPSDEQHAVVPIVPSFQLSDSTELIAEIQRAYQSANAKLYTLLTVKLDLFARLNSLKRFYLFSESGHAYSHFLDAAESELAQPISAGVNIEKLQSDFEHALQSGLKFTDKYIKSYRLVLESGSFSDQLMRIVHVGASEENPANKDASGLTGLLALSLRPNDIGFPLSILLSYNSLAKYSMIFRHLLSLTVHRRNLSKSLMSSDIPSLRELEVRMDILRGSAGRLRSLKAKMEFYLKTMENYLYYDVLESHWAVFQAKLAKNHNVEDLVKEHSHFLDACLKDALLTNWKIYRITSKLLSNCAIFSTFCQKIAKDLNSVPMDEMDGVYLGHQQKIALKQCAKIETNFNFHIKLLSNSLTFYSATDYDHRIGSLIAGLENGFPSSASEPLSAE